MTEFEDVNCLVSLLGDRLRTVLQNQLVEIYVFGSLVYGDFDHDISDIDLLVVTDKDIDTAQFSQLQGVHQAILEEFSDWNDRLEIIYASRNYLRTFKTQRGQIAVISPGEPFNLKEAGIDWLTNWYQVQEQGRILVGPPPRTLIDPISKFEFVSWICSRTAAWREEISGSRNSRSYQAYWILTMCRALYAFENGSQVSKRVAAEWVSRKLPEWSALLENALFWRRHARSESTLINHLSTYLATEKFCNQVLDRIEQEETLD